MGIIIKLLRLIYKSLSEADNILSIWQWGLWKSIGGFMTTVLTLFPIYLAAIEDLAISIIFVGSLLTLIANIWLFFFAIPRFFSWIGRKLNISEVEIIRNNRKQKKRFVKKKGIKFDFTSYLGASKKGDDPILISCVQVSLENTTNKHIAVDRAYIVSNINGKKIPLKIKTSNKGYVDFEQLSHGIPPNQKFYTQALFYKVGDEPEGITYDKFLREFSDFSYIINLGKRDIIVKTAKPDEIKCLLKYHFPDPDPILTLTAQENSNNKLSKKCSEEILKTVSQCYRILKNELVNLSHDKELIQKYWNEFDEKFKQLLDLPEVSDDKKLFQLIQNAENRFKVVLGMADRIVHDSEVIERSERINPGSITTVHRFNQESKPIIDQFTEEKESIFKYCQ